MKIRKDTDDHPGKYPGLKICKDTYDRPGEYYGHPFFIGPDLKEAKLTAEHFFRVVPRDGSKPFMAIIPPDGWLLVRKRITAREWVKLRTEWDKRHDE